MRTQQNPKVYNLGMTLQMINVLQGLKVGSEKLKEFFLRI